MRKSVLSSMVALLAASAVAEAQVCIGLPDNAVAPMNLGVGATFPDGAKTIGVRFGAGGQSGFAGVNAGYVSFDDLDLSATAFGVDGGLNIPLGKSSARLCPVVEGAYRSGPKEGNASLNGMSGSVQLRIGGTLNVSEGFSVLPFVGGGVLHLREEAKVGTLKETFSETGGALVGGFGLQFNRIFVVSPTVTIPVGFETSDATFGVQAAIGFGKR